MKNIYDSVTVQILSCPKSCALFCGAMSLICGTMSFHIKKFKDALWGLYHLLLAKNLTTIITRCVFECTRNILRIEIIIVHSNTNLMF
jgi:hypothetical protein